MYVKHGQASDRIVCQFLMWKVLRSGISNCCYKRLLREQPGLLSLPVQNNPTSFMLRRVNESKTSMNKIGYYYLLIYLRMCLITFHIRIWHLSLLQDTDPRDRWDCYFFKWIKKHKPNWSHYLNEIKVYLRMCSYSTFNIIRELCVLFPAKTNIRTI